eukprot:GEMP01027307.1.p1 GENE.GEMP01027307.1~~GEMP01027307.1.p1  ORF type:complete len:657 (+),score=134.60 GEMP01027307.1:276-2246(+)
MENRDSRQEDAAMNLRTIHQEFSLVGLHLRPLAMKRVLSLLQQNGGRENVENSVARVTQILDSLIASVKLYVQRLSTDKIPKFIDENFIEEVMAWAENTQVVYNKKAHLGDGVFVYDAFHDIPRWTFDQSLMIKGEPPKLLPPVEAKARMIRDRFQNIQENLFSPGSGYLKKSAVRDGSRYDFLRGDSKMYEVIFPAIGIRPSPTDEFSAGSNLADGDMRARGLGMLKRGDIFDCTEWLVQSDGGWFLKIKWENIVGWIPYRHPKKDENTPAQVMVKPYYGGEGAKTACVVTGVESLRGNPGPKVTVGYLVKLGDNWVLEDQHEAVRVDMRHVSSSSEFITRGAFVVAEGFVDNRDSTFRVEKIWHPPMENLASKVLSDRNTFGGIHSRDDLITLSEMKDEEFYVILSEVHIDEPEVLAKLDMIFQRFEEDSARPSYVFMGNFSATPFDPYGHGSMDRWQKMFAGFTELLWKYEHTRTKRIILIPGPDDPFCRNVLPSKPLPKFIEVLPANLILATNPCRIRHGAKKIVLCRQDLFSEVTRHQVVPIQLDSEKQKIAYVKFLAHQGHLRPLPLAENPVLWMFDHALSLLEWPDALIMGDSRRPFDMVYENGAVCSVSPFKQSASANWAFFTYRPGEKVEESLDLQFAVSLMDEGED